MSHRTALVLRFALFVLSASLLIGGCGKDAGSDKTILATVGDREVTADYFKNRLGRLEKTQLPRHEDGEIYDMATLEGKRRFLDIIVDKELMVLKALQLGFDKDTQAQGARNQLIEYNAMGYFWQDEIGDPAKFVAEEDVEYYYSRLGEKRKCSFLITDLEKDAIAAREAAQAGTPWSELVARYHTGQIKEGRPLVIDISWGQYRDEFERPVFAVEVGGVTDPIPTEHGYWLLRVDEITKDKKPDLESIKGKVILSISKRKETLRVEDLKDEMRVAHNFKLDEDALKLVYQGLPEGEQIIDPETQQPVPKDQLKPLDIPSDSYDTVLLTYDLTEGPFVLTLADLKSKFDKMNVFERPKKHEMLGSLRTRLTNDAEKAIMVDEARRRGYFEDPRVLHEVDIAMEELLVDKVHQEIVDFEEYVSPEALEEFWAEHKTEYYKPERRSGYMVRCADLETANTARKAVTEEEKTWKQVNNLYGNDPELEKVFGRVDRVRVDETGTVRDLLFAMSIDEISEPVQTPEGWIVVQLTKVFEPEQPELKELTEVLGQRIKNNRKDEALRAMLNDWADEFGVVVYEDRLAAMPSWEQLMEENMRAKMSMPEK